MPNNCLSVLYKHIIQVENKNVGLKVGGAQTYHCPPIKNVGGHMPPLPPPPPPPPASYASDIYMHMHIHISTQFVFSLASTEMLVSACIYHCIDFKPITIFLIHVTAMAGQCTNARSTDCTLGTCSVVFVNAGTPRLSMTCSLRHVQLFYGYDHELCVGPVDLLGDGQ